MKIQGYTCEIERAEHGFVASFPELPGLRAYGVSRYECRLMADECVAEYFSDQEDYLDQILKTLEGSGEQSVQSEILDAVVSILGGTGAKAFRCRFSPFESHELPADNVIPEEETPEYADNSGVELRFRFHVRHTAAARDAVDVVADARYVRGAKLLLEDPTLGGMVRYCRYTGRKWEMDNRGTLETAALVATYEVEFSTTRQDPSVRGF